MGKQKAHKKQMYLYCISYTLSSYVPIFVFSFLSRINSNKTFWQKDHKPVKAFFS